MTETIAPLSFSLIFSYLLTRILIPIAPKLGLIDIPCERKKHKGEIPLIGGLSIYGTVLICTMLFTEIKLELLSIVSIGGLLTMIGSLDDKFGLSPRSRLIVQFFAGILLVFGAGIELHMMGNLLGFGHFGLTYLSVPFTAIGVAALANAYNMTDGIDGLAASLGIVAFSFYIITLYKHLSTSELLVLGFYIISLITYLFFNFAVKPIAPTKVFMGDAGSMFIGFSIGAFAIYFTQNNKFGLEPGVVVWFVAVPLFDMVATMIRRMKKGQSPFYPDRTHLHHLLMHLGLTPKGALRSIVLFSFGCGFTGWIFNYTETPSFYSFYLFIVIFLIYLTFILKAWKIKKILKIN